MLYEVSTSAPLVYVAAAIVVAIVAFVATLLPARGATKVDPMVVLRGE
jgi:ABC-type antimicrobial peptide transport system permease subunit